MADTGNTFPSDTTTVPATNGFAAGASNAVYPPSASDTSANLTGSYESSTLASVPPNEPLAGSPGEPMADPAPPEVPIFPRYEPPPSAPSLPPQSPPVVETPAPATPPASPVDKLKLLFRPGSKLPFIVGGALLLVLLGFLVVKFLTGRQTKANPITLTYWGLFEPVQVMQGVIADYEKLNPNVTVVYEQNTLKEYRERLQTALSQGKGPDIFRLHQSWLPMFADQMAPLPATVYTSSAFAQTFYPSAVQSLTYRGVLKALPLMYDGLALYYNEELFRAAGQTPPKTWDELRQVACNLTVRDEVTRQIRTAGFAAGNPANVDHWSDILALMLLQNQADLANPATQLGADSLAFFSLFSTENACRDSAGRTTGAVWDPNMPPSTYAFSTNRLAMYLAPSWRAFEIEELKKQYQTNVSYKIIPVPQLPGSNVAWASFWAEGVSKTSVNSAAAWDFLKYLSGKEVLTKLYQTESQLRLYGELYPRQDMADLLKTESLTGAFVSQAPYAQNWYLSSNTNDNGVNSKIIKYYEDAANTVLRGGDAIGALTTATEGVTQIFSQYRIPKAAAVPQ